MVESYEKFNMEHSEGSGNKPSLHTNRIEINTGRPRQKTIAETRFWRLRPDDIVFRPPTESEEGIFCILEFKRMSDITDQYLTWAKSRSENQYVSLQRALGATIQHQG
jgi:hypothetical protein